MTNNKWYTLITNDKLYALGTAVRATGDTGKVEGYVEGYLVPFTTSDQKDYYDTYFDADTDYDLDNWPLNGRNVLYHHGQDKAMQVRTIGRIVSSRVDEKGLWVKAQLDLRDEYEREIYNLAKRGIFGWSSGALPASVDVAADGHMNRWYPVEASLTPIPATPQNRTLVSAIRSIDDLRALPSLTELMAKEGTGEAAPHEHRTAEPLTETQQEERAMSRDELKALIMEVMSELGMMSVEIEAEKAADEMEATPEYKAMQEADPTKEDEMRAAMTDLVKRAVTAVRKIEADRKATVKDVVRAALKAEPEDGVSKARAAGSASAHRAQQDHAAANAQTGNISVGSEFDRFSTEELAMTGLVIKATLQRSGLSPEFMGEHDRRLIRALATRVQEDISGKGGKKVSAAAARAFRAAFPFRANELDATNIVGQGLEWVGVAYSNDIWEAAREIRIYEDLIRKGMQTKEVPLGSKEAIFFTEGADPVAYNSPEANSVDSTGRPEITVGINPFGTAQVVGRLAYTKLASSFTFRLSDSSPADIGAQLSYQMREKAMETIEQLFMNGDTATAANTNINIIDGTPQAGIFAPYYIGLDGFRKFGLVTNPSLSADAGGLINSNIFKQALGLLPSKLRARKDRMAYVLSAGAEQAALSIPELLTRDVNQFATLESGVFRRIWGVDSYTSGFVLPSNTTGKVSLTAANNTRGTIMLVYAPYIGFGFQRNFNLEVVRDPLSDTNTYVGGFNMTLVYRSNDALSIIYNTASEGV